MRRSVYQAAVAAAFLGSVAGATAAELNLTTQDRLTIEKGVQTEKAQPAPAGYLPAIGTQVPQGMTVRQLPSQVTSQVPAAKNLEFAKLDSNEVLLIDPKNRSVAEIIQPAGSTGAATMSPSMSPSSRH
jgi:hypothetical protein